MFDVCEGDARRARAIGQSTDLYVHVSDSHTAREGDRGVWPIDRYAMMV